MQFSNDKLKKNYWWTLETVLLKVTINSNGHIDSKTLLIFETQKCEKCMCHGRNEAADVEVERQGLLGMQRVWESGLEEDLRSEWRQAEALSHDSSLSLLRAQSWLEPHGLSILHATNLGISREISLPKWPSRPLVLWKLELKAEWHIFLDIFFPTIWLPLTFWN